MSGRTGLSCLTSTALSVSSAHALSYILEQADVDGNGTIDYGEFISATMHMNRLEKEDHIFKAFEYFDKDHSG
jgi:calcium-dependent protein kinase